MKKLAAVLLLTLAASASAETSVTFHVQLTDGRTALRANPKFDELQLTEQQVEDAAKSRVMMLDKTSGTHWTWLILSWPEGKTVEHRLDLAGVAPVDKGAIFSLQPVDAKTVKVRCLQEQCVVNKTRLTKDQAQDVAFDSDVTVSF